MSNSSGHSPELFIDLSRTDHEKAAVDKIVARFPNATVVAAHERKEHLAVNVNTCLGSDLFWVSQATLAQRFDAYFDGYRDRNLAYDALIDGMRGQIFEHNLHEIHKWLFTLDELLQSRDVSTLTVWLPKARSSNQMFLFEAEGEVSTSRLSHMLYSRTDFLLRIIEIFLANMGINTRSYGPITRDWIGPRGRSLVRTYGLLAFKAYKHIVRKLTHISSGQTDEIDHSSVVALTRSVVHSDYLSELVKAGHATPLVQDGILNYPDNMRAADKLFGRKSLHFYDVLTLWAIIKHFLRAFRDLLRIDIGLFPRSMGASFTVHGVDISLKTCLREAITNRFECDILSDVVRDYLIKNPHKKTFIHCELFTSYAPFLRKVTRSLNVKCYQVAFGTYEMRPVAQCVFSNGFLCFSTQQERSLRGVRKGDMRIQYRGNLYYNESAGNNFQSNEIASRLTSRHIVYYTQPYNESVEDRIIEFLAKWAEENGYAFSVVVHPRGRANDLEAIPGSFRIIYNAEYIVIRSEIEASTTLAVTRSSNVGYQLLLRGVPLANVLLSPIDRLVRQEYYEGYPLVVETIEQLAEKLVGLSEVLVQFYMFRDNFVRSSYRGEGVSQFTAFIEGEAE